jgi:hypothetical protein
VPWRLNQSQKPTHHVGSIGVSHVREQPKQLPPVIVQHRKVRILEQHAAAARCQTTLQLLKRAVAPLNS